MPITADIWAMVTEKRSCTIGNRSARRYARNLKSDRDPLYLFLCHLEWRNRHNLAAYNELVAALDGGEPAIRELARNLIHRQSRPTRSEAVVTGHPENDWG